VRSADPERRSILVPLLALALLMGMGSSQARARGPQDLQRTPLRGAFERYPGEPLAVRVAGVDRTMLEQLERAGFDVTFAGPTYVEILARPADFERLAQMGLVWEPLARDLFPGARESSREGNLDFQYHTYQEMLEELQQLASDYPDICRLYDIGDAESRHWTWTNYSHAYDVWAVRISDNPDWDEPEPCIVYDGRHHAREPVTTEITLAVARYFCENYGVEPEITDVVNTTEIWCVPMVNPDGHQWVEDHDPWWRKTLWDYDQDHLVDSGEGIDPNRNYDWHWYGGSWSDETYGGPAPWSAREVATMRDLHNQHRTALNPTFHSYGEVILYPFGYGVMPEPAVTEIAAEYAGRVGYSVQQSTTAHGSSKDWIYGSLGGVSFTVETATEFIPTGAQMETIVAQILPGSIWLAGRLWGPSIHGTVIDSVIGIPLAAAIHIPEIHEVYGAGELWDIQTEAGTGYFCRLRPAAQQTITLEVSAEGYHSKTVQAVTGGTQPTIVAIELVPESFDRGILAGTVTNATMGGTPLPDVLITVRPDGPSFQSDPAGAYVGYVDPGTYTVAASHPSFAPDSVEGVVIVIGETTSVDFSLYDVVPPEICGTTDHPNTSDDEGPYPIETTITDVSDLAETTLRYRTDGGPFQEIPLTPDVGNRFTGEIPGQPYPTSVQYYIYARDEGSNAATDPAGAPVELYGFYVVPEVLVFEDRMEDGAPGWSHYVVSNGFADQWHLSNQRNHTPAGFWSWKCGDTGSGNYANLLDAGLQTPEFVPAMDSRLALWHWIDAEASGSFPGYAYDGGIVEISVAGGDWEQITPEGGYPYLCREGSAPGPFPAGTPMFSGNHDWEEVVFDLSVYSDPLRIRLRFGSDGADAREGWYIDDLEVTGLEEPSTVADLYPAGRARTRLVCAPTPLLRNQTARISYCLAAPSAVEFRVFDPAGRLVRRLTPTTRGQAGNLEWNARDAVGRHLGSGVYLMQLTSRSGEQARVKIIVLE
jgi:hypothetical protein